MAKSAQRIEARRLRKQGFSINEIARRVEVSKSSASLWCNDIELTKKQKDWLIRNSIDGGMKSRLERAKRNKRERLERLQKYMNIGIKKIARLSRRELFILGSGLYWAEGCKKNRRTVLVNSDPKMINIFVKWLRECLGIDKDRIYCHVSINQDHAFRIEEVEKYWSKVTRIPRKAFTKVSYKKVKNKKFYANFNNHYGTLFVKVRKGTNLNYEILGYIEGLKKNIA